MNSVFDPSVRPARLGLTLLGGELNRSILVALARRPMSQHQLKAWLIVASATTLHRRLRELLDARAIERQEACEPGLRVQYELTPAGVALLGVLAVAARWLHRHPSRPLEPTSPVGWRAFAALVEAWDLGLIQAIAERPRSSEDLRGPRGDLSAHKVERELVRLSGAGILRRGRDPGGAVYHGLSDWGRLGIGVLAAAARWERAHVPRQATPVTVADATAGLIATLPLVRLPEETSGICAFTFEADPRQVPGPRAGAVWAEVGQGRLRSCGAGPAPRPPIAWAHGSIDSWFEALIDGRSSAVKTGGRPDLSICLRRLHARLYGGED
ncbi:MAG: helix-turn-helix transcriptional regulator [Solirubrobacterales bacterium]|nr:helix-turn-helix transcriptional regulator [Solirubrobacterales bacterium]